MNIGCTGSKRCFAGSRHIPAKAPDTLGLSVRAALAFVAICFALFWLRGPVKESLAAVTNHLEAAYADVASFSGFLLFALFTLSLFPILLRPGLKHACHGHFVDQMLDEPTAELLRS